MVAAIGLASAAVGAYGSVEASKNNKEAAAAGANQSGTQNGTQNNTSTTALNPAISQLLGLNGGGILGGVTNSMGQQNLLSDVGKDFINQHAEGALNNGYAATDSLIKEPYQFPTMGAAQIAAPGQNGINLTGTFNSLLGGGDTSALMNSLQAGNALTNAQFQQNTGDVTDSLMKTVLPSIRSNSVLAGQYGGSRQGVAEGNAISDYTKQLTNGATQVGLANSANNASQIAGDYQQGQNRALAAAQGLSGQQYSTAATDAAARQAADNTNVNSLLNTNALNSSNKIAGIGLQQGLVGAANGYSNSDLQRLGMSAGILAPFTNAGATVNTTSNNNSQHTGADYTPYFQNTAGNVVAGGLLGAQVGGQLAGQFGSSNPYAPTRNEDNYGVNTGYGLNSLNNMQGSTSSSIYGPSSGGTTNWGAMSSLFS